MTYDVAIIGAGPGGYVAAIRASQLGFKTVLVEKDSVGGTCLNRGCVPTKSFVAVAEKMLSQKHLVDFGIEGVSQANVNIKKVVERKNNIVASLKGGIQTLLKGRKVDVVNGTARLVSKSEIEVATASGSQKISAQRIIIATGSTWRDLPNLKADGKFILNSDHMLDLNELPKKLLIVGGGAIGCEFASIMNAFGVEVAMVELMDQLLPADDASVARMLTLFFKKRGIKILTKTSVISVNGNKVMLSDNSVIEPDKILVSVGRRPCTNGLNLEAIGVEMDCGFVLTDESMRTNISDIFAIGDVAIPGSTKSKPALAHVASNEGLVAVKSMKSSATIDYSVVPRPVFTIPEIACVGLTEKELKAKGVKYKAGRFPYGALSKAVCDGEADGLMQVYADENDLVLGCHCIGNHASDICSEIAVAMRNNLTISKITDTIHAHPTYSEIIPEALEDVHSMAIHKAKG